MISISSLIMWNLNWPLKLDIRNLPMRLTCYIFVRWQIFARSAKLFRNAVFTAFLAWSFVLRPSPLKLLLYGPPHSLVILFYGPPNFRVPLFSGPPLGIWSPPCPLINDNSLSIKSSLKQKIIIKNYEIEIGHFSFFRHMSKIFYCNTGKKYTNRLNRW